MSPRQLLLFAFSLFSKALEGSGLCVCQQRASLRMRHSDLSDTLSLNKMLSNMGSFIFFQNKYHLSMFFGCYAVYGMGGC